MLGQFLIKKRSIIFTWLISYVLVLIIPVIIASITYVETVRVVEKQVNSSNLLVLRKIRQQMDGLLKDAEQLSEEIGKNTRISGLLQINDTPDAISGYDSFMTVQDLRNLVISGSPIDNYYVYYKNLDFVLSGSASMDSRSFFNAYITDTGVSYRQWHDVISEDYNGKYITVFTSSRMGKESKAIVFIRAIPFGLQANTSANIIISINESSFMEDARDIQSFSEGSAMILNKSDYLVASSNVFPGMETIRYDDLENDTGMFYSSLKGKKYVVSYITSEVNDWKYIAAVPYSVFWDDAEYVRKITLASLLLCMLVGGIAAYISVKKNYTPVTHLIKLLESKHGLSFNKKNNEYLFIQQVMDKIQADKEKVDSILKQQNKEMRAEFFARLLKGRVGANISVPDLLELYNIRFKSNFFAVVIFYIEEYTGLFDEDSTKPDHGNHFDNFKMVQFIITNVVEEMIGQKGNQGFVVDIDDMLVCLVNFTQESIDSCKEELERIVRESQEFFSRHFHISYTAAAGGIRTSITEVSGAYSEALQALEFKKVLGMDNVTHYQDIIGLPTGDYYYPLEVEQQLINCIKTGDYEESRNILEDIFDKNFKKAILSAKIAKCLMFDLVSTMIKTINETNYYENENEFLDRLNPVERLLNCEGTQEMKQELMEILQDFCSYIKMQNIQRVKGIDRQLVENVIKYVEANYDDPDMGVTGIAEKFNVHLVHLSKVFKEIAGEGLLDFINKLRVAKAKDYLKKLKNLEEVAKKVGYTNIRTFSRVFKKYEGITAGRFKELE